VEKRSNHRKKTLTWHSPMQSLYLRLPELKTACLLIKSSQNVLDCVNLGLKPVMQRLEKTTKLVHLPQRLAQDFQSNFSSC